MALYSPNVPFIPPPADYNAGPPANAASTLMMKMLAIQERKRAEERQRKLDEQQAEIFRLAQADRERRAQIESEDRALASAKEEAAIAADKDREGRIIEKMVGKINLTPPKPQADPKALTPMDADERAVHEATGAPPAMDPDELAVHLATGAPPSMDADELAVHEATGEPAIRPLTPMDPDELAAHEATGAQPLDELDLGIDNTPQGMPEQLPIYRKERERGPTPTIKVRYGGRDLEIPLYDRTETLARRAEDEKLKLDYAAREAAAKQKTVKVPNLPEVFGKLAGAELPEAGFNALVSRVMGEKRVETSVNRGNVVDVYYSDGTMKTQPVGAHPTAGGSPTKGRLLTDTTNNSRVWVPDSEIGALMEANPGRYSDIKPPSTRINRTDPGRIQSALTSIGTGSETDDPDSIWSLAVKINSRIKNPVEGWLVDKSARHGPEQFTTRELADETLYIRQVTSVAATIAKAFGDSGNLSNQDIQRAMMIFPKIGESLDTTLRSLQRIRYMLASGNADTFREIFGREPRDENGAPVTGGAGEGTPEAPSPTPTKPPPPGFRLKQ